MAAGRARAPRTVGRYELVHELSQSYLGPLWAVRVDGGGASEIAMLRLLSLARLDADTRVRLLEAAWQAMEVRDPGVCAVTDVVASDGELGVVAEYAEGVSLRALSSFASVRRKPAPAPVALKIVLDLLSAVGALHRTTAELGDEAVALYGGLSADSVLVGASGRTQVLDIAVASAASPIESIGGNPERSAYAAPEQLGSPPRADARTDVFAAAVLAWELLGSRRLFVGADKAVVQKVLTSKIPKPDELRRKGDPEMPAGFVAVVMRALERDPQKRFPSAEAFSAALLETGIVPATEAAVAEYVENVAEGALSRAREALRKGSSGTRHVAPARTESKPKMAAVAAAPAPSPARTEAKPKMPAVTAPKPAVPSPAGPSSVDPRAPVRPPLPARVEAKPALPARTEGKPQFRARQPTMIGIPAPAVLPGRDSSPHLARESSPHLESDSSPRAARESSPHLARGSSPQVGRGSSPQVARESSPHVEPLPKFGASPSNPRSLPDRMLDTPPAPPSEPTPVSISAESLPSSGLESVRDAMDSLSGEEPTGQYSSRELVKHVEAMGRPSKLPSDAGISPTPPPSDFPEPATAPRIEVAPVVPETPPPPSAPSSPPMEAGWLDDPGSMPPPPSSSVDRDALTPDDPVEAGKVVRAAIVSVGGPVSSSSERTLDLGAKAQAFLPSSAPAEEVPPIPPPAAIPNTAPARAVSGAFPSATSSQPQGTPSLSPRAMATRTGGSLAPAAGRVATSTPPPAASATYLPSQVPPPLFHDPRARSGVVRRKKEAQAEKARSGGALLGVALSAVLVIASAALAFWVLRTRDEKRTAKTVDTVAAPVAAPASTLAAAVPTAAPTVPTPTAAPTAATAPSATPEAVPSAAEPAPSAAEPAQAAAEPAPPAPAAATKAPTPSAPRSVPRAAPAKKKAAAPKKGRYVPDDI